MAPRRGAFRRLPEHRSGSIAYPLLQHGQKRPTVLRKTALQSKGKPDNRALKRQELGIIFLAGRRDCESAFPARQQRNHPLQQLGGNLRQKRHRPVHEVGGKNGHSQIPKLLRGHLQRIRQIVSDEKGLCRGKHELGNEDIDSLGAFKRLHPEFFARRGDRGGEKNGQDHTPGKGNAGTQYHLKRTRQYCRQKTQRRIYQISPQALQNAE